MGAGKEMFFMCKKSIELEILNKKLFGVAPKLCCFSVGARTVWKE